MLVTHEIHMVVQSACSVYPRQVVSAVQIVWQANISDSIGKHILVAFTSLSCSKHAGCISQHIMHACSTHVHAQDIINSLQLLSQHPKVCSAIVFLWLLKHYQGNTLSTTCKSPTSMLLSSFSFSCIDVSSCTLGLLAQPVHEPWLQNWAGSDHLFKHFCKAAQICSCCSNLQPQSNMSGAV